MSESEAVWGSKGEEIANSEDCFEQDNMVFVWVVAVGVQGGVLRQGHGVDRGADTGVEGVRLQWEQN